LLRLFSLNFVAFIREIQCFIPPCLEERTSLRKDAPKQANYEELAYDEKTTIYTKTAFVKVLSGLHAYLQVKKFCSLFLFGGQPVHLYG
jgi:hypothetical protein